MPNAVILAARLAGRPILMRAPEAEAFAARLLAHRGGDARTGFAGFLQSARRAAFGEPEQAPGTPELKVPEMYWPLWMERQVGAPDGVGYGWTLKDGIALVDVSGPLVAQGWGYSDWDGSFWVNGYDTLAETFAEVAADDRVKAVFVHFSTPGGVADPGLPALANQIRAMRADAGGKPVWGWCDMAASAGYWIASACDRLFAPGLGYVGSIGAVAMHCDQSGALEKDGFKVTYIQFGAKKTDGSPNRPLSEGAAADWQAEIDEMGAQIVAGVVAGRPGLTEKAVLDTQAGCFLAQMADPSRSGLALGLVDAIADEAAAFAALRALISDPSPPASAGNTVLETEMKRADLTAILNDPELTTEAKIRRLEEAAAAMPADDEDKEDEKDGGDDEDAEGEDDGEEDGKKTPETTAAALDGVVVLAILELPEAKGRDKLARALARQPGMTAETARGLLSAAPKGSSLSERMEGRDPQLAADGGQPSADDATSAFILNAHAAATGRATKAA